MCVCVCACVCVCVSACVCMYVYTHVTCTVHCMSVLGTNDSTLSFSGCMSGEGEKGMEGGGGKE